MKIFLVGYMGCGKTSVGKKLSKKLEFDFLDLDHYIVEKKGMTIPEIFENEGEAKFREYEAHYLQKVINKSKDLVVATGGGTPCKGDNMAWMNEAGITLYLKQSPAQLASRLIVSKNPRPLLKGMTQSEIESFAIGQLEIREPYYSQSQIVVDGASRDITRVEEAVGCHPEFEKFMKNKNKK